MKLNWHETEDEKVKSLEKVDLNINSGEGVGCFYRKSFVSFQR